MEPLAIRLLEQDYEPIMVKERKAMYYCERLRNLLLVQPIGGKPNNTVREVYNYTRDVHYTVEDLCKARGEAVPEGVDPAANSKPWTPYEYMLNVLNTQTDAVIYWYRCWHTTSDYKVYLNRDTQYLATKTFTEVRQLLEQFVNKDCDPGGFKFVTIDGEGTPRVIDYV